MKKIILTLILVVLLFFFFTNCQKEDQVKNWIPIKVQVNPVKVIGDDSAESKNMDLLVDRIIKVIENRLKLLDVKKFKITRVADLNDQLIIELPLNDNVVKMGKVKVKINPFQLISNLCAYPEYKIELKLCTYGPDPAREYLLQYFGGEIPENMEIVSGMEDNHRLYYTVLKNTIVSSKDFSSGKVFNNQYGEIGLRFKLKDEGAKRLKELTSKNVGKKLAFLLDDKLILAPIIENIVSEEVQIIGVFSPTQAIFMAALMKAGSLPKHLVLPTSVKVFDTKIIIKVGSETKK